MSQNTRYHIGIDPSLSALGWAIWDNKEEKLIKCGVLKPDKEFEGPKRIKTKRWVSTLSMLKALEDLYAKEFIMYGNNCRYVLEAMSVFNKFAAGSLLPLGWITGFLVGKAGVVNVLPAEATIWTTKVPKEDRVGIIEGVLEKEVVEWPWEGKKIGKSYLHNGIDAVGMALWGADKISSFKVKK
jgi:hypothetical protein